MSSTQTYVVEALLQAAGYSKNVMDAGTLAEELQKRRGANETKPEDMDSSIWYMARKARFLRDTRTDLSLNLTRFSKQVRGLSRDILAIQVAITTCLLVDSSRASVSWAVYARLLLPIYTAKVPGYEDSLSKALTEVLQEVSADLDSKPDP